MPQGIGDGVKKINLYGLWKALAPFYLPPKNGHLYPNHGGVGILFGFITGSTFIYCKDILIFNYSIILVNPS